MSRASFAAIRDFRERWSDQDKGDFGRTGRFTVEAQITYDSPARTEDERADVTIVYHGYEDGQIDIEEVGSLAVEDYHLRFQPPWQDYSFTEETGALTVSGKSDKMGGDYIVTIQPS